MSNTFDIASDIASDNTLYSKQELELLGTEISAGKTNYGKVTHFKYEYTNDDTRVSAVTDLDFEFDVVQLLSFIWQINCRNAGIEIVYPDGTDYSKRKTGPQRKAKTSAITGHSQIHPSHYLK